MKKDFVNSFDRMLQGLAYWLAYRDVTCRNKVVEAVAVDEAFGILQTHLPVGYKVVREFNYKGIAPSFGNKYADLAIVNVNKDCECLIEFKLSDNTGGGYQKDVLKLNAIKSTYPNIDCCVVILYRKSCLIDEPHELVSSNGKANRSIVVVNKINTKVKRVFSALRSKTTNKMKRVICIELV